jgi:cell division protein FtsL
MQGKKYMISFICLLLGLISIHILKNKTRELELKIEKVSQNIISLKEEIEVQKVEFSYLSNPQRISNLAKEYLKNDYIPLFPNKIISDEKK